MPRYLLSKLILLSFVLTAHGDDPFADYDLQMYERPSVRYGTAHGVFDDGLYQLWLRALDQPDAELRRMVIDTLVHAYRRGVPGVAQSQQRLLEIASEPKQRLDVIRAVAQALIAFDARDQTDLLAQWASEHGSSVAQIVEPALANWKADVFHDRWLKRVAEVSAGVASISLAIQGLAALGSEDAIEHLLRIMSNQSERTTLRIEAAKALARIEPSQAAQRARGLVDQTDSDSDLHYVLALELLTYSDDADTIELLDELVGHQRTVVQSRALNRLYAIDFELVDRQPPELVTSNDSNVRRIRVQAMIDSQRNERIQWIAPLLDDVNPSIRRHVAESLVRLAEIPDLRDQVIAQTSTILNQDSWRGCEQACVVLSRLDHEPGGTRMVELLKHPRGEVKVSSARALTRLRVEALLPDMLEHAEGVYQGFKSLELNDFMPGASLHLAHLFVAFGDQRYAEAEPLIRKYIPKNHDLGTEARAAAVWAIGMLHEDDPQADLVELILERFNDAYAPEAETEDTRQMCAVSLGRMNAESALPSLRKFQGHDTIGRRSYWAIERITGEPIPDPVDITYRIDEWFMAPIANQ